jgi:hypothetical protein
MLDLAESDVKSPEDYPLLLTMAMTGLTRAEIVADERPRSQFTIAQFPRARKEDERKLRESILQRLIEGKVPFVEVGQRTFRFSPNRKKIKVTSSNLRIHGLKIEDLHGDSITIKERSGRKPKSIKLHPFLSLKLTQFVGDRTEGRIFPISGDGVYKKTRRYGKLARIPFAVHPRMFEKFYENYQHVLTDVLGVAEVTPEFVKARTKEEDEEIEWKARIGDPKEFCETLVSFSNRIGGMILLGVDNEGVIQGVQDALTEIELKVTNLIHDWCDPHVLFKASAVEVEGKTIVVVDVKEGIDKPYWLKEKGFLIRNGSSDRIMKRSEVIAAILGKSKL